MPLDPNNTAGYPAPSGPVDYVPSEDNSNGIPVAQPIPIITSGDPNNTAIDMDEAESRG